MLRHSIGLTAALGVLLFLLPLLWFPAAAAVEEPDGTVEEPDSPAEYSDAAPPRRVGVEGEVVDLRGSD